MDTLKKYLLAFKNLRIDRAHGNAPHKPILLLAILDSVKTKSITKNEIFITPEIVALFKSIWNALVVSEKSDCHFTLPFFHLKTSGFWRLQANQGFENMVMYSKSIRSFAELNAAIEYAEIDQLLFELMKNENSNQILKQFLLEEYFPNSKNNFPNNNSGQQKIISEIEGKILHESAEEYRSEIIKLLSEKNEEEVFLRGSIFKREIPKVYNGKCCISGMRIDATISLSMIDACHIIPFSESYNDTITNGIALCPNLHRAFDRGLISIDDDFRVIVSKSFKEDSSSYSIRKFENQNIFLPSHKQFHPLKENLYWHRKNIFKV